MTDSSSGAFTKPFSSKVERKAGAILLSSSVASEPGVLKEGYEKLSEVEFQLRKGLAIYPTRRYPARFSEWIEAVRIVPTILDDSTCF